MLAIFDLDGTLVDSRRDLAIAADALAAELGGTPLSEEAVGAMVGEGAGVLVRRVLAAAGLPPSPGALSRFLELYDAHLVDHTRPYDGIVQMLTVLRSRMPMAILTNKPQGPTDRLLAALQLQHYFVDVVGGDTPAGRKPDPAGLLGICRRALVPTSSTVLIGDSPIDLETARRAGCAVVLVSYGFGYRELELRSGERVVGAPSDLTDLL